MADSWIVPCNVGLYDPFGAFPELKEIDWRQSVKIEICDTVYIYCSKRYSKIMFKTVVVKTNISPENTDRIDLKSSKGQVIGDKPPHFGL